MNEGEGKNRESAAVYGTQPVPHADSQPVPAGFPMPSTPPDVAGIYPPPVAATYPSPAAVVYPPVNAPSAHPPPVQAPYAINPPYYAEGYQNNSGGAPEVVERLPCWGLGFGWFLFIIGFFLAAIPWYVGAFLLLFFGVDYREKPGYMACTIAAAIAAICAVIGLIQHVVGW